MRIKTADFHELIFIAKNTVHGQARKIHSAMNFEDILEDVGGFGLYQKLLMTCFLIPTYLVVPWFFMSSIFMTSTPDHWCFVPEVASSNISLEAQKLLIRPPDDPFCYMYDIDYNETIASGNWTETDSWRTKKCDKGYQFDTTEFEATAVTKWNLICDDASYASLVFSLTFFGNLVGTPLLGLVSDKLGRRPTFLLLAAAIGCTEIGSTFSPYLYLYLILKAMNGACLGTIYNVAYMIVLEVVSPECRAHMIGVTTTAWSSGLCLLPFVAFLTGNWIYHGIATACAAFCLLLYAKFIPESPRLLLSQGKYEAAADVLVHIAKFNGKSENVRKKILMKIQKIKIEMEEENNNTEKASPLDFFRYPTLRKRFLLISACWFGISGTYFGFQINVKNLMGNEFLNFFLVSAVELPAHLLAWWFVGRIGRRWCTVGSFLLTCIACLIPIMAPSDYATVGIVASLLGKGGASAAFMTVYLQAPEIYPTTLRAVGLGMSNTVGLLMSAICPYIVYLAKYSAYAPFLILSAISLMGAVCASFLPETLNKNLPQTVEEAENFEKDQKFFSCFQGSESDMEQQVESWKPRKFSMLDHVISPVIVEGIKYPT